MSLLNLVGTRRMNSTFHGVFQAQYNPFRRARQYDDNVHRQVVDRGANSTWFRRSSDYGKNTSFFVLVVIMLYWIMSLLYWMEESDK